MNNNFNNANPNDPYRDVNNNWMLPLVVILIVLIIGYAAFGWYSSEHSDPAINTSGGGVAGSAFSGGVQGNISPSVAPTGVIDNTEGGGVSGMERTAGGINGQ